MATQIIFVHGLGGGKTTWGKFPDLIKADSELNVQTDIFEYPTPPLGIKLFYIFQKKYQSIEDLAKSLKTVIDEKYRNSDDVVLVGHSMGGLVIRKYLLEEKVAGRQLKVKKVILYAVPNRGAKFASCSAFLCVFKNPHILQLKKQSEFIKLLNESWARSKLDILVDITVAVAGNDKIVTIDSAEAIFQHLEPKQISGVGHLDIVKPATSSDLSFIILKNAILKSKLLPESFLHEGCNFVAWQKYHPSNKFQFLLDEKRQLIFSTLKQEFSKQRTSIRIKGLSGLGKTRLIFEVVLDSTQEIKDMVVYVDVATGDSNLKGNIRRAIELGFRGILIVDNCKAELHTELRREIEREDSQVQLVTLGHGLEKLSGINELQVLQFDTPHIKQLLESQYGNQIPDLDRIAAFAQGFPQMAVLIADARLLNDPEVGKLSDDELAKKLLGEITEKEQLILRGCSLFDRFGLDGDVSDEFKYMADEIVQVSHDEFYRCIKKFEARGLIDVSGRFGQLVPKPLAVRLASEWWYETHRERQEEFIEAIPQSLVEPFCRQVTMLGFIPEVQNLTQELCGPQGPFGQAEVILSNRGSRLLRAFVEVNPIATTSALYSVLKEFSNSELASIKGEARRNLVYALERMAFHSQVFEEAAWCLMLLASSENETWSNNATGMFAQLFRVYLAGTEAEFELRIHVIQRALNLNDFNLDRVVLKALEAAIDVHGGYRTIGAEYQGNKEPLKEWQPKLWQEVYDYWSFAFDRLVIIIERNNENSNLAQNIIGHSIRQMIGRGRVEMLDFVISRVVELRGRYWPAALESIKHALEYDSKGIPEEGANALQRWLKLLSPDGSNLAEKLRIVVINPPWEHHLGDKGHYEDIAAQNAEQFALELSANIRRLADCIPLLLSGEQRQTFVFGRRLAIESSNVDELLPLVLDELRRIENPNQNFARGLLSGIYTKSASDWNSHIEEIASRKDLIIFYPDFICTGEMQVIHLSEMLEFIRQGELNSDSAIILSYGRATSHLSSNEISSFCMKLSEIDSQGAWTALAIMFMYCYGEDKKFEENKGSLISLVTKVPLNKKASGRQMDMHHWEEVSKKLIATDGLEFSKQICLHIISATDDGFDHGFVWHSIQPLLKTIMTSYGKDLWPIFGKAIVEAKPDQMYWLQRLFSKENSFETYHPSIFSVLPEEVIIKWCNENLEVAPYFVGGALNVFEKDENGVHPTILFVALLEHFGHLKDLGGVLSANLGTRGWTGSLVPYLESEKSALTPLLHHSNKNVSSWVENHISYLDKSIAYESRRDDELRLGYF